MLSGSPVKLLENKIEDSAEDLPQLHLPGILPLDKGLNLAIACFGQ